MATKEDGFSPHEEIHYLERTQNLFGQAPFDRLTLIADSRNLDITKLRLLLPYVHAFQEQTGLMGATDEQALEIISQNRSEIDRLVNKATLEGITGRVKIGYPSQPTEAYYAFREAFADAARHLKDFPKWHDYIEERIGGNKPWARTGNPNPRYRWYTGEKFSTYASLDAEKKLKDLEQQKIAEREKRQVLLGIDEVFPGVSSEIISEAAKQGGPGRANRNWRIRRGSELTHNK